MSLFLVENNAPEPKDVINESGGAHQKLAKLRADKVKKHYKNTIDLAKLKYDDNNGVGRADEAIKKIEERNKKDFNKLMDKGTDIYGAYDYINSSRKSSSNPITHKLLPNKYTGYEEGLNKVHNIKKSLGVGEKAGSKEEGRKPGIYKKLQDIKRNEAFDICADYVVGCLEGSIDDFDLDLFTEAASFIIDCLDE